MRHRDEQDAIKRLGVDPELCVNAQSDASIHRLVQTKDGSVFRDGIAT